MPTVLLITEQARLRQLFTKIEQEGMFRLRIAPTLAQGEEEMAVRLPDYVFVENRTSGLPGGTLLRHLCGLLPEGPEVILMTRDAAEADEIREIAGLYLDLSDSDEALQRSIRDAITRDALPQSPPQAGPFPASATASRELFFDETGSEGRADKKRRLRWLIPLALCVIGLSALAYQAGKKAPRPPPQNAAAVAPQVGGARSERGSAPAPAAPQRIGSQAAQESPGASGKGAASSRYRHYVVQPGDNLRKILVRDFGFSDAVVAGILPELKRLNKMKDLKRLKPGQRLVIPVQRQQRNKAQ